jgi:hypothetical protein
MENNGWGRPGSVGLADWAERGRWDLRVEPTWVGGGVVLCHYATMPLCLRVPLSLCETRVAADPSLMLRTGVEVDPSPMLRTGVEAESEGGACGKDGHEGP